MVIRACGSQHANVLTIPIEREAQFDLSSFDVITGMVEDPAIINVLESSGLGSIDEFIAAVKERPGKITVGTSGVGSANCSIFRRVGRTHGILGRRHQCDHGQPW